MKKSDMAREVSLMRSLNSRGNSEFSSFDGEDDSYDGMDYYGGEMDYATGRPSKATPKFKNPQRTIKFKALNHTGVAAKTTTAAQDLVIRFFNSNIAQQPGSNTLGLLDLTAPTLNAQVDGQLLLGRSSTSAANIDLEVTGNPASYRQILADSGSSPYEVAGAKYFFNAQAQIGYDYAFERVNLTGEFNRYPVTPSDKFGAGQYQTLIIEDNEMSVIFDPNTTMVYTLASNANAGLAATASNSVQFTFYLFKITEQARSLRGKSATIQSPTKTMPTYRAQVRMIK